MNQRDTPQPDRCPDALAPLLSELIDGSLTDETHAQLQDLLRKDADSRRYYLRFMQLHATMQWSLGQARPQSLAPVLGEQATSIDESEDADALQAMLEAIDINRSHQEPAEQDDRSNAFREAMSILSDPGFARYALGQALRSTPAKYLAAAAILALGVALTITLLPSNPNPNPTNPRTASLEPTPRGPDTTTTHSNNTVATLTATHNAVWASKPAGDLRRGDALYPNQRLTLTQGFAEITTARGAIAILEAPATIELLNNDNALRLHTGKLVGLCHANSAKGFVVKTDHADITDLGTEFGVTVTRDSTEATVFVGEIAVKTPGLPTRIINHSQTARVSIKASTPLIVVDEQHAKGYTQRLPRPALITNASINLPGFEVEVVPSGVYEDAKLFTDRDHELNGNDSTGLPSFLIGADLVRMPASARPDVRAVVADQLELEVTFAQPADVFLLIQPDSTAGAWLERDYVNTGLQVGFDLIGKTGNGTGGYLSGIGPGVSVERQVEVWKRKQPVTGRAIIAGTITGTMYAVLAHPVETGRKNNPLTNP